MTRVLTLALAEKFAMLALSHVSREYPNKLDHVLASEQDQLGPRELHPIFFGSFDWHSCVHGYWLLSRALRRFPQLGCRDGIETLCAERFTPGNVRRECAYLERPYSRAFERPYGWAWLLALQSEMDGSANAFVADAADCLQPLSAAFAARFRHFLDLANYPMRSGVHASSAFALRMAADYAERRDPALFAQMTERVVQWYGADRNAQAWEPSQEDFLSPTLIEAECMRRFLPREAFHDWFGRFMPAVAAGEPATLFQPAQVADRHDAKIAHLDGLNLSRAWCWRALASALDEDVPTRARLISAADAHLEASLPHVSGDYVGEHWLATFATLALDPFE